MTSPVFALCDGFVDRQAALDPVEATFEGVQGHEASATDYGPDGIAARADLLAATLRELDGLTRAGSVVDPADLLAADHIRERCEALLAWHGAGEPLRELRTIFGPLQVARTNVDLLPQGSDEQWRLVVGRLAAVPAMLEGQRAALTAGAAAGTVAARRQALECAEQAAVWAGRRAAAPAHAPLLAAYGEGPLRAELATAADGAHGAYEEMSRWLGADYAPRAATADGVGADRYAVWSRLSLGADLDPAEAYAWGWEELHRLESEMGAEADRVRAGASVAEAVDLLDSGELPGTVVDGPDAYLRWLQDAHDRALDELDGVHVDIDPGIRRVEVRLAPPGSAAAPYYTAPSEDLVRPGRTWWPLMDRERFSVWNELTTVFHEGVPGHHLQLGQAKVAGDRLSRFSRNSFVSGHGEGWALYAEKLSDELGWFTTPGERLGMLKGSAFRAARVVVDLGLHLDLPLPPAEARRHGDRWSFETAVEVLRDRGRLAPHMVHSEVTRYAGWPGQAPSYKLGERAWLAARSEARQRLGDRFSAKAWHTAALDLGPLGLGTFAGAMARWPG